ncbi:hypothetical protein FGB62_25g032 [Gracilaria domingensis]|nr:hypothetical protein FGB62_25g032 [Gracilaria domingensis]
MFTKMVHAPISKPAKSAARDEDDFCVFPFRKCAMIPGKLGTVPTANRSRLNNAGERAHGKRNRILIQMAYDDHIAGTHIRITRPDIFTVVLKNLKGNVVGGCDTDVVTRRVGVETRVDAGVEWALFATRRDCRSVYGTVGQNDEERDTRNDAHDDGGGRGPTKNGTALRYRRALRIVEAFPHRAQSLAHMSASNQASVDSVTCQDGILAERTAAFDVMQPTARTPSDAAWRGAQTLRAYSCWHRSLWAYKKGAGELTVSPRRCRS